MNTIDVIYIEDDEIEAELFTLGLSTRGVNVLVVSDGDIQSLNDPAYQAAKAVFIDFWIGVTNGLDVARALRDRGDNRPFFLLTAGENPNPALLRELNITYLQKPASYGKIAETLSNL
ncbi:MAG: response regulator [Anaerolineae bacterium]|nr:response regulator [Anaerolineae bacterium]MBN8619982.1 response regulator [Anaerolineae bacterium]